jgi:hypothetical protein
MQLYETIYTQLVFANQSMTQELIFPIPGTQEVTPPLSLAPFQTKSPSEVMV